ncbi:hypothetical protein G7Y89_g3698 [Cudoniella acicularis]|uniref:Amidohydrolase-related domain-containing protein n=1 Tax=Cudoniella acicularis TaxID=354080 RepID=A0A8H4W845_9HELO|nr:hypothetical protein G7Y89_g3698 [Cudoniella acicularis]
MALSPTTVFSKHWKILLSMACLYMKVAFASSLLLHGGTIIAFDNTTSSLQILRDSSLLIVDDRIQALFNGTPNTTLPPDVQFINVTNKIVSPGFVDTHRHGWQTAFKTIASNTSLPEYLLRFGEYAAAGKLQAEDVYIGQLTGVLEALNAGVTTILDHAHGVWDNSTADAGLQGSIDSGGRVFHAHTIHALQNGYTIEDQIAKLKSFAQLSFANSSVELGLAYDGWSTSPSGEVNQVAEAARTVNLSVITSHFLGGQWSATNSPSLINSYNLLNTSTPFIFSHGSFISAEDAGLLRSTNQYLSTTPESESHYGHGDPNSQLIMDQASLGVDTHFTFSTDIITQARIWNVGALNPMSANQAFLMATRHGGLALRRDDLGVIKEGAKADIVVFNGNTPALLGWVDPVAAVILHSSVGDIEHVIVDGKFVKRDGKLTFDDYEGIQQRFLRSARKLQQIWKDTLYPVMEGAFNNLAQYENPQEADVLRGNGTGYGILEESNETVDKYQLTSQSTNQNEETFGQNDSTVGRQNPVAQLDFTTNGPKALLILLNIAHLSTIVLAWYQSICQYGFQNPKPFNTSTGRISFLFLDRIYKVRESVVKRLLDPLHDLAIKATSNQSTKCSHQGPECDSITQRMICRALESDFIWPVVRPQDVRIYILDLLDILVAIAEPGEH